MNATVFHQAVADGDATKVKFLINLGQQARVNQLNKHGYTSLQQSCKDGNLDVANVLLNHGANPNAAGRKGRTALHLAAAGGYAKIVELLIGSCADVNAKDNEGNLPIDVARTDNIVKLLSKAECEKKAKSAEGNKKGNTEEWSQSVKSLPAGTRNSLVSNSSSDSGVFTEDATSSRNVESKSFAPRNGSGSRVVFADRPKMGVLNEGEEVHDRARYVAETTVKPQPKLRRSMSDRFASRPRRTMIGRRNISEELSALNLSRSIQEDANDYYFYQENELRGFGRKGFALIESPNEDLGYGPELQDDVMVGDFGRTSRRKFFGNHSRSLPRKRSEAVVCYAEGDYEDEGWDEEEVEQEERFSVIQGTRVRQGSGIGWGEVELYPRGSQSRNMRSARRGTVDKCEVSTSHEIDSYQTVPGEYFDNERLQNAVRSRRPRSARGNETIVNEVDTYSERRAHTITRKLSSCSDTAVGKYYQRRLQTNEPRDTNLPYSNYEHYDYNCNREFWDAESVYRSRCGVNVFSSSGSCDEAILPDYEETISNLRRLSIERARRPASRQVSQV